MLPVVHQRHVGIPDLSAAGTRSLDPGGIQVQIVPCFLVRTLMRENRRPGAAGYCTALRG